MRHLVKGKKIGRNVPHRKATLQALSNALIKHHRITTTVAKAKELRSFFEPLVTRAKEDNPHNRRQAFSKLQDKEAVSLLFDEVAPKSKDRPGGYTRVIKAGFRSGDSAEMAVIELVDYNDIKPESSTKRKRTRRAGKSKKTTSASKPSGKKDADAEEKQTSASETETAETDSGDEIKEKKESDDADTEQQASAGSSGEESGESSDGEEEEEKS